jgi:RNA polymerase sigma-70 factor (ECF subfamily)
MAEAADVEGVTGGAVERVLVAERARLVGLAYRITGSLLDAEDVVQEAWERARRVDPDAIDRPAAWLTTVVSRLALDHLRSAQHRRETYVGPWLPEPVATGRGPARGDVPTPVAGARPPADPGEAAELAESLTFGFLRVLEALSPLERAIFVLADVFATPFPEIATIVGRTPDACRQIAHRARDRVRDEGRRHQRPDDAARVADDLVGALVEGDADRVLALLAPDVVMVSDGGPTTHAARRPVVGADRVGRLITNLARRGLEVDVHIVSTELNGEPGFVAMLGDQAVFATALSVEAGRIARIHSVVNPDKLAALRLDVPIA